MIWILLILFQIKHFIADYLLQGKYMLGKFKDRGWILPLAAHCSVHFYCTYIIASYVIVSTGNRSWFTFGLAVLLGLIDFTIHFIMDRLKASSKYLGKHQALSKNEMLSLLELEKTANKQIFDSYLNGKINVPLFQGGCATLRDVDNKKKSNTLFWWSLGLDQMVHHLTDILIIYLIMTYGI